MKAQSLLSLYPMPFLIEGGRYRVKRNKYFIIVLGKNIQGGGFFVEK
ncbi:MAG TPA: hypothetical protein VK105_07560 [Virgibacillus sp.]|nr:hypothetical protein [Virgibacillus sp.]HLR66979.1 hypothetical protein [Virgibacillus sp.]